MIDITGIVQAIFALVSALVAAFVIPYMKRKLTAEQQADLSLWVNVAVTAAEQLFGGSGKGAEKKAYVIAFLEEHGFTIDADAIDALIEAAVYRLKKGL